MASAPISSSTGDRCAAPSAAPVQHQQQRRQEISPRPSMTTDRVALRAAAPAPCSRRRQGGRAAAGRPLPGRRIRAPLACPVRERGRARCRRPPARAIETIQSRRAQRGHRASSEVERRGSSSPPPARGVTANGSSLGPATPAGPHAQRDAGAIGAHHRAAVPGSAPSHRGCRRAGETESASRRQASKSRRQHQPDGVHADERGGGQRGRGGQGHEAQSGAAIIPRFTRQHRHPQRNRSIAGVSRTFDETAGAGRGNPESLPCCPSCPRQNLALADGRPFGTSIGAPGSTVGEGGVQHRAHRLPGNPHRPSYCRQIVTLTYPHIGNTGVNRGGRRGDEGPCRRAWSSGPAMRSSNFRARDDLVGLPGTGRTGHVAHRRHRHPPLTRVLRTTGAQNGCIVRASWSATMVTPRTWPRRWRAKAAPVDGRAGPGPGACRVDKRPYDWTGTDRGRWGSGYGRVDRIARTRMWWPTPGAKHNILRLLAVRRLPRHRGAGDRRARRGAGAPPDGMFLSTAGRPRALRLRDRRRANWSSAADLRHLPGHQILALASGAKTFKMKFGHHGANHPVKDLDRPRQHHEPEPRFAGRRRSRCSRTCARTHAVRLFDGPLQGLRTDRLDGAFCFQGPRKASPGPQDINPATCSTASWP